MSATGAESADSAGGVRYDDVEVGTEIPARDFSVQRWNLIQYAGASGDFNIIHWNERFAKLVGLPDVISHGMFTMATAGRLLTDWAGDPGAVVDYGVRFSSMVPVPDDDAGATLTIRGTVEEKLSDNRVSVAIDARLGENKVLTQARAVVRLA
jgi:acyl dehydratase